MIRPALRPNLQWIDRHLTFQGTQGEGRAGVTNALDPVECFTQKALVVIRSGNRDLDQVVVVTRDEVGFEHLRNAREGLAEAFQHPLVMPVEGDLDEDGVRQTQGSVVKHSDVALNHAAFLQPLHTGPAGRRRQPHPSSEFIHGESGIGAQCGQDTLVDGINGQPAITHRTQNFFLPSHAACPIASAQSRNSQQVQEVPLQGQG